jgi:hypothetical protein
MGAGLLDTEEDYTGLATLDPKNPQRIFISTPIDPSTQKHLEHHEIFCGVFGKNQNGDDAWQWSAITKNSTSDNLRPLIHALPDGRSALLWLQGNYEHQTHYATTAQARILAS